MIKTVEMGAELLPRYQMWDGMMKKAGLVYALTSVLRKPLEQIAYATQGRTAAEMIQFFNSKDRPDIAKRIEELKGTLGAIQICNVFRKEAGLYLINPSEWYQITWTLKSLHLPNKIDNKSDAFDFVIIKDGKEKWDVKIDTNKANGPDYDEAGRLAKLCGLSWGGDFPKPDRPHIQYMRG